MLSLLAILFLIGVTILVVLWAGTLFLQRYWYTEPTGQIYWQAPASAGVLTVFWFVWCLFNVNSAEARPESLPYDTVFRLSSVEQEMTPKPVEKLWAITKSGKEIAYKRKTDYDGATSRVTYRYVVDRQGTTPPWPRSSVIAIDIEENKEKVRFKLVPSDERDYRRFVDDRGWVMVEDPDGPTGQPTKFLWGRLLVNLLLNFIHLGVWFVCLWLILRFQWSHALGVGLVLWLITTLLVVPMFLREAGAIAQQNAPRPGGESARLHTTSDPMLPAVEEARTTVSGPPVLAFPVALAFPVGRTPLSDRVARTAAQHLRPAHCGQWAS